MTPRTDSQRVSRALSRCLGGRPTSGSPQRSDGWAEPEECRSTLTPLRGRGRAARSRLDSRVSDRPVGAPTERVAARSSGPRAGVVVGRGCTAWGRPADSHGSVCRSRAAMHLARSVVANGGPADRSASRHVVGAGRAPTLVARPRPCSPTTPGLARSALGPRSTTPTHNAALDHRGDQPRAPQGEASPTHGQTVRMLRRFGAEPGTRGLIFTVDHVRPGSRWTGECRIRCEIVYDAAGQPSDTLEKSARQAGRGRRSTRPASRPSARSR